MKTSFFSIIITLLMANMAFSQAGQSKLPDSTVVKMEKTSLSEELMNLHDSITVSIGVMNKLAAGKDAKRDKELKDAAIELGRYKERVKLDMDEVKLTATNSWTPENAKRLKTNIIANRREFHRITGTVFKATKKA